MYTAEQTNGIVVIGHHMDVKQTQGEPRLLINRKALLDNAAFLRRCVGTSVQVCAIVKADAYGHDASIVVDTLTNFDTDRVEAPAVDALAVASIDEADRLPESRLPVIIFRPTENVFLGKQREALERAILAGWVLTLCTPAAANDVARVAMNLNRRALVQVMVDTGMNRSGVRCEGFDALVEAILKHPPLKLVGLSTHFAGSEDPTNAFTHEQLARFHATTDGFVDAQKLLGRPVTRHVANSGGIFHARASHLDMVRPGLSLYGIDPTGHPNVDRVLRPVMKWTAPLVGINELKTGESVGYNATWTAPKDCRIGIVPVGYADGYNRLFSNRASMVLHGKPAQVVGRVSMDLTTINLTNQPQAVVGDEVTVLDDDPLSPASVYKLAQLAETIPYEIFCRIGHRVKRVPLDPVARPMQMARY